MWFKQAQLFQFSKPIPTSAAQLSAQLEAAEFSACLPTLPSSCGWVAPIDETEEGALLAYKADKFYMICLQLEEKILPAAVVRQAAIARIEELEALHDKKLPHSEKKQIKEEMQHTMLPRAFSKITKIYAYIDIKNRWLIVNTATTKKLELFINFLKRTLGQDFYLPKLKRLAPTMTQWLLQPSSCPKKLDIKSTGVLQDARQSHRVIRCQNQNLYSKSIQSLLQDGCE
nr:recombination-associated protein RdgC [Gammaproteobacteria bacterium]